MVKSSRPLPGTVLQLAEEAMTRAKALGFRSGCQVRETGPGYRLVLRIEESVPGEGAPEAEERE
jgi:hypothetical protein